MTKKDVTRTRKMWIIRQWERCGNSLTLRITWSTFMLIAICLKKRWDWPQNCLPATPSTTGKLLRVLKISCCKEPVISIVVQNVLFCMYALKWKNCALDPSLDTVFVCNCVCFFLSGCVVWFSKCPSDDQGQARVELPATAWQPDCTSAWVLVSIHTPQCQILHYWTRDPWSKHSESESTNNRQRRQR